MMNPKALKLFGLLAATLVAAPFAQAQQPLVGGTLQVAATGPVTVQLLADETPASLDWYLPLAWKTGPRILDYSATDGHTYTCRTAGPTTTCGYTATDFSGRIGREEAEPAPSGRPGWSNNARGATISSPSLAAGTVVFVAASTYSGFDTAHGWTQRHLIRTGGVPGELAIEKNARQAVVFAGPGNSVLIGLTDSTGPRSTNFLDYPIRVLVTNVYGRS